MPPVNRYRVTVTHAGRAQTSYRDGETMVEAAQSAALSIDRYAYADCAAARAGTCLDGDCVTFPVYVGGKPRASARVIGKRDF